MAPTSPGATGFAGTARDQDNHVLSRRLPVELGVNRVLVRAGTQAGRVHLAAAAAGLTGAVVDISTRPAPVAGGLSTELPEDAQRSDLSRGPTPAGGSVVPGFTTVKVATITAGSAEADAGKSHDDNEATTWSSDGQPAHAWIEYRFARPEPVSSLSLRLPGWRLRSRAAASTGADMVAAGWRLSIVEADILGPVAPTAITGQ